MKKKKLVSVIVNCYNGEKYLSRCIRSILSQSYKNLEVIFWNNLSSDKSEKIVKKFSDKRIKIFRSVKFLNLYDARNQAIKKAKGHYVSFLDVDDYWHRNKLKKQVEFLKKNSSYSMVYSNFYTVRDKSKKIQYTNNLPRGMISKKIIKNYCIGILTVCIKKIILKKKKFNKNLNIIGDFDFFLKFSLKNKIGCIQEPLAYYQLHKNNYSEKNIKLFICELNNWIRKNEKLLKRSGLSLKYQKLSLFKLKLKNYLKIFGRVVQW